MKGYFVEPVDSEGTRTWDVTERKPDGTRWCAEQCIKTRAEARRLAAKLNAKLNAQSETVMFSSNRELTSPCVT